jgi:hypothetical protein
MATHAWHPATFQTVIHNAALNLAITRSHSNAC